jgi:hypothetical protein
MDESDEEHTMKRHEYKQKIADSKGTPVEPHRKPTSDLVKTARDLASELFVGPCENSQRSKPETRCLEVAEKKGHNKRTGERTPFYDYDPSAMCLPCSAYWHAERAAQLLEHRNAAEIRELARRTPPVAPTRKSDESHG